MVYLKIILMAFLVSLSNAYKILVVFPIPGASHSILGQGYVKLLLKAGHEVCKNFFSYRARRFSRLLHLRNKTIFRI